MTSLQSKLSEIMSQKKISAVEIEKSTGLNRNTIYSILAGNSKSPSAHNLQLIAKALDVSLEYLLIDKEEFKLDLLNEEQITAFREATNFTINIILEKKINLSLDKLANIIKDVYQYSIKNNPPNFEHKFIDWILEKYDLI